jgi:hypothetical protein
MVQSMQMWYKTWYASLYENLVTRRRQWCALRPQSSQHIRKWSLPGHCVIVQLGFMESEHKDGPLSEASSWWQLRGPRGQQR